MFAKVAFKTVGGETATSINIVDSASTPASLGSTPQTEAQEPNFKDFVEQVSSPTAGGRSDQKDASRRMEKKLGQAIELISKQREDIDLLLKSVSGLRRGLVSVQESIGHLEMNNKPPDTTNFQAELGFMRRQLDALQATSSEPLHPAPQTRPYQTAKMKGPLARRPLELESSARSPTFAATIRESTNSGGNRRKSPIPIASTELRDVSMSEDPPPPSANPFEDGQWRTNDKSRRREKLDSSPGTFGRSDSITVASSARNNAVDRIMGPPASFGGRPDLADSRHQIRSSIEYPPRLTGELIEAETQEYLQRTVATDDADDTDYEPSNRSASPPSTRPSGMPASVEVQSSLDNILDSVTRSAGNGAYGPSRGDSARGMSRSRTSWDGLRQTSEWYEDNWTDPEEAYQNGTTPSRTQLRGSGSGRRGVSRGFGSERGTKWQKTARGGKVHNRRVEKQRDAEGYLLRANGTRDMRSARYRDKQSAEEAGAVGSGEDGPPEEANDTITMYGENHQRIMGLIFPQRRQDLGYTPRNNVIL